MHSAVTIFLRLLLAAFVLHVPVPALCKKETKIVTITNNHTNYLSVRCFSFDNQFDPVHLPPWGQYKFLVVKRVLFSSATMFNCSTNMGTFVAYSSKLTCFKKEFPTCDWRFDEGGAYVYDPVVQQWNAKYYAPNYESLDRGGVVQGYYAN